ncbi:helix-turn-helix domain-containing protein [Gynurincola endophyticus]|uniref:helix-turn-helix domain-containing protein n=1 Tax=Gynurincola endophyticus TaxID=2479004 RepID=UPI000F8DDEC9|nr:helix-turn-helix domain-containing protein [Gynurincola endophyticus]
MNLSTYLLFFVGAIGVFNGLMLGTYYTLLAKKKSLAGILLGCLLVVLSIRIGKSVFIYFDPALAKIYLQIGLSACLLIGPFFYFFIRAAIEQPATLPKSWKVQLIIGALAVLAVGIVYPYALYPELWGSYIVQAIYLVWLIYIILAGWYLKPVMAAFFRKDKDVQPAEKWLLAAYVANVLIYLSFQFALLFKNGNLYFSGAIVFSLVLYGMILFRFYKEKSNKSFYLLSPKPIEKKITEAPNPVLVQRIEAAMKEQTLYKDPALSLATLAKAVELTTHQLSHIINEQMGKNFTSYVNDYRIEEACKMMAAGHPFSIEAIGYEVGFNSKSAFYTAFKKIKNTTPSAYKEKYGQAGAATA